MHQMLNVVGMPALGWFLEYVMIGVCFLAWYFIGKSTGFDPELHYDVVVANGGYYGNYSYSEPNAPLGSFIGFCVVLCIAWLVLISLQMRGCRQIHHKWDEKRGKNISRIQSHCAYFVLFYSSPRNRTGKYDGQ